MESVDFLAIIFLIFFNDYFGIIKKNSKFALNSIKNETNLSNALSESFKILYE